MIILLLIAPGDAEAQHKAYEPGQVWTFEADELNEHARIVIGKVEALPDLGPTAHVIIVGARVFTVTGQLGFIDLFMSFSIAALDMSVIELERTVDVLEQFDTSYQKLREVYNEGGAAVRFARRSGAQESS